MPSAMLMHGISIHALRKESDRFQVASRSRSWLFQSTLSVRRATSGSASSGMPKSFQSTLSVRRATNGNLEYITRLPFQSTLSVRRATALIYVKSSSVLISIHALRKESDDDIKIGCGVNGISIHALRKESDVNVVDPKYNHLNFNPRSP